MTDYDFFWLKLLRQGDPQRERQVFIKIPGKFSAYIIGFEWIHLFAKLLWIGVALAPTFRRGSGLAVAYFTSEKKDLPSRRVIRKFYFAGPLVLVAATISAPFMDMGSAPDYLPKRVMPSSCSLVAASSTSGTAKPFLKLFGFTSRAFSPFMKSTLPP